MNKLHASLVFVAVFGAYSSASFASWKQDCDQIQSEAPSPGLCDLIQKQVEFFNKYAPIKPFHDLTVTGDQVDSKFPWGSPTWASGSGGGGSGVVSSTTGSSSSSTDSSGSTTNQIQQYRGSPSTNSFDSTGTFQ